MESFARYADGVIYEMQGDVTAATEAFARAAANAPEDEELTLDVSMRLLRYNHPERALEVLTNAIAHQSDSAEIHARLGLVYSQLGQTENALRSSRVAVRKDPALLVAWQQLYVNHLQNKRETEALKVLDDAARIQSEDADFLVGIAGMYSDLGVQATGMRSNAQARARELLLRAATLAPTDPSTQLRLADGLNTVGESGKAVEFYQKALDQLEAEAPLRKVLTLKLAELCLRTGDRKRAAELFEAVVRDDPTNPQANYVLGSLAFEARRMQEAADSFSRVILLNPAFEQAYYDLATAQLNLDRPDDALATLAKARERFDQSFVIEYLSGLACGQKKDYATALKHYTAAEVIAKATDARRLSHGFYFQTAVASERSGDFENAARQFEKCLELSPNFAEAQNYLGYMWAERGTNLDRACELIERAVQAEPENAAFLDSLGWVRFKLGRLAEALEAMERALKHVEEPDPTLFDHLGDIQAALGALDKARESWRKSLELEPNEGIRKKLNAVPPN